MDNFPHIDQHNLKESEKKEQNMTNFILGIKNWTVWLAAGRKTSVAFKIQRD